jgi:hypothetical protein
MKRLSLLLALLTLATPTLAAVRIVAEPQGDLTAIKYETDGEKVRAFALDITVDAGEIIGISDFVRGESMIDNLGYGIFPANFGRYIVVDPNSGEVAAWDDTAYTPIADPCDPGALGGLGTDGITIEMGALYYPTDDSSPNAPPNSGTLFLLMLSEDANLTVALNEIRGGIVLTDLEAAAEVNLGDASQQSVTGSINLLANTHSDYAEWVAVGKPACWALPRQCRGDADGQAETDGNGSYYVGQADLDILLAAYEVKEAPFGPGVASVAGGICADFARDKEGSEATGYHRVGATDLNILVENWLVKEAPEGPGVPADCGGTLAP